MKSELRMSSDLELVAGCLSDSIREAGKMNQVGFDAINKSIDNGAALLVDVNRALQADIDHVSAQLEAVKAQMQFQTKLLTGIYIMTFIMFMVFGVYSNEYILADMKNYLFPGETPVVVEVPADDIDDMRFIVVGIVSVMGFFFGAE